MSKLISGKEALIALANGDEVEYIGNTNTWFSLNKEASSWTLTEVLNSIDMAEGTNFKFRLKPRTIKINGIEVPAPFEPNSVDHFYYIDSSVEKGYSFKNWASDHSKIYSMYGAWRTEEEIKQVVAALRQVFKGEQA